jgi:FkbM family methyltransferase
MEFARALVRNALRRIGLEKIHHPSVVDLMLKEGIETVLDVGANQGHFGIEIRERGYRGRIVSFEPISAVFEVLRRRAARDPAWDAWRCGVGDREAELEISVAASHVFSSFKPPSDYTAAKWPGAREVRRETAPVVRLDAFLADHPEYLASAYLKIDTQGMEREVLAGAGDLLPRFRAVQLEVALRTLYEGQDTLCTMVDYMADRGFEVAMAKENGFDWQAVRLLELDIVFVRSAG